MPSPYDQIPVVLSVILVVVLLGLLTFKELLRASGHPHFKEWRRKLNLAILPLTFLFFSIVLVRFLALLPN